MTGTKQVDRRAERRRMSVDERRLEIVMTAATLFDRLGYAGVSVDQIAEEVGVAKPTLYYYFTSKQDILEAIHHHVAEFLTSRWEAREREGYSAPDLLYGAILDVLEMYVSLPGHQRVWVEHQRELSDSAQAAFAASRDEYRKRITQLLLRGVEDGVWAVTDPKVTTMQILGMCGYIYQWYSPLSYPPPAELAATFWRNIMSGIATGEHRSAYPQLAVRAE